MSRPALDDVAADLRLSECGFHLRRQPPCPRTELLGHAKAREKLQTAHLLDADRLPLSRARSRSLVRYEAIAVGATEQRPVNLRELRSLDRVATRDEVFAVAP